MVLQNYDFVTSSNEQVESYYEHMIYPETLYGAICSGKDCTQRGKILAFNPAALGVRESLGPHVK